MTGDHLGFVIQLLGGNKKQGNKETKNDCKSFYLRYRIVYILRIKADTINRVSTNFIYFLKFQDSSSSSIL
ncbi:hypothetical protein BH10BAC5_BH10BAC5_14990 [soil metagenome]